ncbi:hypothetical protein MSLAZ_2991 [Methanosarcina lacustris Z-7289]|uniref:Uncharacterized protein n=1 Tax=Methanosarcina lacustris Z-7289 TaxID=1434111 RepID=A0A0E3S9G8_9EURY|nr:hypothetical protein [Methanosarcina lacustris]AKB76252.1 hypothetical protein MSLAZ_2991 [Methanosarcina lacustris Z-7289]
MEDMDTLKKHLDHMSRELSEIKKLVFGIESGKKGSESSDRAWDGLTEASEEISDPSDVSAVDEMWAQRKKSGEFTQFQQG